MRTLKLSVSSSGESPDLFTERRTHCSAMQEFSRRRQSGRAHRAKAGCGRRDLFLCQLIAAAAASADLLSLRSPQCGFCERYVCLFTCVWFVFCMLATLHCTCSMQARSCLRSPSIGQNFNNWPPLCKPSRRGSGSINLCGVLALLTPFPAPDRGWSAWFSGGRQHFFSWWSLFHWT